MQSRHEALAGTVLLWAVGGYDVKPTKCDVHFKNEGVFVVAWTIQEKNPCFQTFREPIVKLDREPNALELGQAVCQALDTSGSPVPDGLANRIDAALRQVGVRGWSGLIKSSRSFSIDGDGTRVKIGSNREVVSSSPEGARLEETSCNLDPEEIGRLLLRLRPSCPISEPLSHPRTGSSYRRTRQGASTGLEEPAPPTGETPVPFGYKSTWLVINTVDANAVVLTLALKDVQPWRTT